MDKDTEISAFSGNPLRVEPARFAPFTFQVGVDAKAIHTLFMRVQDAHLRLIGSPLAQVANQLQREVLVSSIFSTNTIEGGQLSEEETRVALDLDPAKVQTVQQQRVRNIRAAYELAQREAANPDWLVSEEFIREVHRIICRDLDDAHYRPGVFRDNPPEQPTFVGDETHGGRYKPPQYGGDIQTLIAALVEWHAQTVKDGLPALVRAPLVHLYYEMIHPFWDGNGRVGRVLEAAILHAEGFRYAPFALARYYLEQIDRYFALFNLCRKQATRDDPVPNSAFVQFHLEGMLSILNNLHDRVNRIVNVILFEAELRSRLERRELNAREYAIVTHVLKNGGPMPIDELRLAPWYRALYARRTDKTRQRDLRHLREQSLLKQDRQGRLWPGFVVVDDPS
jgi:Fic family protein